MQVSANVIVTVWGKSRYVHTQNEFILLPQLITTLNNYACSLPPLANVNWCAFSKKHFADHVKSTTGEMVLNDGYNFVVGT